MKRFYCTICKRVKRVRIYPVNVVTPNSPDVHTRSGMCSWHNTTRTQSSNPSNQFAVMGFGEMKPRAIKSTNSKKSKSQKAKA